MSRTLPDPETIPYGYCHCGCGQKPTVAKSTYGPRGHVKGEPYKFLRGHSTLGAERKPGDYVEEDRGFATPCWIWQKSLNRNGYSRTSIGDKQLNAHRAYYIDRYGAIPDGLHCDHLCRQRACVNPEHIELVTCAENARRGAGAKLTEFQVREIHRAKRECEFSNCQLARAFGVSSSCVDLIFKGQNWKGVA